MSISTISQIIDPNLEHRDVSFLGPQEYTVKQVVSTSYSQNNATFNAPPPSLSSYCDRCVYMSLPVSVVYAGTSAGAMMVNQYDAFRAYPIHSIINTIQCTINDRQFSIQANEIVHPTSHYRKSKNWDLSPTYLDKYQVYADGVAGNNNPLGTYLDSYSKDLQLRGSFPCTITNGATSSTLAATLVEPIMIPPFLDETESSLGFTNVSNMSFTINYSSNLARIVSHAASTSTISSVTVTLGQPTLFFRYATMPYDYVPRPVTYGSQQITYFTTPSATLTANSTATIASTNVQMQCVPSHMYIFCRESNANLAYTSTDTYTSIENISLTFANKTGILSSASKYDLFEISKQNGLVDSWPEFSGIVQSATLGTSIGTIGSVVRLNFGKNIPLSNCHVGESGSFNMQMNVGVKNVNQSASITAPTLYIITVTPSKFTLEVGGATQMQIGMQENMNGEYVPYDVIKHEYGGNIFTDGFRQISKALKPVVGFLQKYKPISTIATMIPDPNSMIVGQVARSVGFGRGRQSMIGEGGMMTGGMTAAGMQIGGQILSRKDLMSRIQQM